jgi:murein tripeptide amidase MpaA
MLTQPQVVEYLTYKLIEGYSQDATATKMLDSFDFFILPVVNPDGKLRRFLNLNTGF